MSENHAHELRRYARKIAHPAGDVPSVMMAAADEIERLQVVIAGQCNDSEIVRLRMRLELDAAQAEVQHLRGCIARLLRYANLQPGITAKSFLRKNMITIEVPARAFATASGIAHKYNLEAEK